MISKPRLLSIINTTAYLLNALETFGCGPFSSHFSADQNNATISDKYQTIITPFGFAFSIWGVIFLMQAIFCYVCNFGGEEYSAHPLVVSGVSYYYLLACLAQTAWSPAFAYEKMPLSAVVMGCILIPLIVIAVNQNNARKKAVERNPRLAMFFRGKYYWLLQFPFELHLGWIMAAFALNINVVLVANKASSTVQVVAAAISLGVLGCTSILCLLQVETTAPIYCIPSVISWASFFIYIELHNPKALIVDTFGSGEINGFRVAAISVFFLLIGLIAFKRWSQKCKIL
jgi:tryptophan-rich sensory protein/branched-subunit amino acid transport protein AzlD